MAAQLKHEVETTFINLWVEAGIYNLRVNREVSMQMRRQRVDLLDVNFVLRTGVVVRSDMLGSKGLWDVRGRTVDGAMLELEIVVISAENNVELLRVVAIHRR